MVPHNLSGEIFSLSVSSIGYKSETGYCCNHFVKIKDDESEVKVGKCKRVNPREFQRSGVGAHMTKLYPKSSLLSDSK